MIVVDTNILVYAALPGRTSRNTDLLLQHDPLWAAPMLWRSEFRNVAAGYMRRKELTRAEASVATKIAADHLLAGEYPVNDERVFELVEASSCTAYDCEFVALAMLLGTRLVTEDRAVLRNFPAHCVPLTQVVRGD